MSFLLKLLQMKTLSKFLLFIGLMVTLNGCEIAKIFGPYTLDAPTVCLIDDVCYKSSQESIGRAYWPGQELDVTDNAFRFDYQRTLKSSEGTAVLYFCIEQDAAFEIGVEYPATGVIYLSDRKYEFSDGWIKFLDYRGTAQNYETSYLSGAFEFTARSSDGDIIEITEGTFDELPVTYAYYNEPIWKSY